MARRLKVSKRANQKFEETLFQVEGQFGERVAGNLAKRVYAFYDILIEFPGIGTLHDDEKGIYGFVLEKQLSIFYRFNEKEIIILNFFDNRSDPSELKY